MKVSQFPLNTIKEDPAEAELVSHKLMLRAGLIRRLASGLYTWSPLGLRVLRKIENIVREEMNKAGALELLMPTVQPAELWEESGRLDQFGPQLLRFKDRHDREFCYGPTHEEIITDYARRELKSYKQLPINYYQIQLKFRDEIRPRFGVMRSREFIMKDAYSFHSNQASLQETYDAMYRAYDNIFTRLGLRFRAVLADSGAIGGSGSQEFHVLADSGEDAIAHSTESDYAANIEKAEAIATQEKAAAPQAELSLVDTPKEKTIAEVCAKLQVNAEQTVKTLLLVGTEDETVAVVLRGDHELNEVKAANHPAIADPVQFVDEVTVKAVANCEPGFVGPMDLNILVIADHAAACLSDFVAGAKQNGKHYTGVNWQRDAQYTATADLRNVVEGDPSPDGKGTLKIVRGIEVGHIFQLGDKYSSAMNATILDENGKSQVMTMGCYGIGVTRIAGAAIEQNHDDRGIIWPQALAPFDIAIVGVNLHKSEAASKAANELYTQLQQAGYDVLLDDRDARPGFKFADMELIGIPHRLVVGDKGLEKGIFEYKHRQTGASEDIPCEQILDRLKALFTS